MVFAVLIYRLAVSTLIYRLLNRLPAGPSIADLTVSITAAIIQLIFIQIFNFFYERIALWLTKWGKYGPVVLSLYLSPISLLSLSYLSPSLSISQNSIVPLLSLKTLSHSKCTFSSLSTTIHQSFTLPS